MVLIQVDIGGQPPFPNRLKQFSGNFGNLLFLAGFNFWGHFEVLILFIYLFYLFIFNFYFYYFFYFFYFFIFIFYLFIYFFLRGNHV
jgi:hypothetical protein